jgi:hypothetical protein
MDDENVKYSWNHSTEKVIKDIGETCKAYKIMHNFEAQKMRSMYNWLMLSGVVLGPISGIISATGSSLNLTGYPSIVISQTAMGFLSGIFVAILRFGRYDEVSTANKSASAKYSSLESNIRRQLSLYRLSRVDPKSYMEWVESKYDELLTSAPILSDSTFIKYSQIATQNGWEIPGQYSNTIEINEEYEEEKILELSNQSKIVTNEKDNEEENNPNYEINIQNLNKKTRDLKLNRTNTMSMLPEINSCSDQMLKYEMTRLMGIRSTY